MTFAAAALGAAQILALVREKKWLRRIVCCTAALACAAGLFVSGREIDELRRTDYAAMQELTPDAIALYDQVIWNMEYQAAMPVLFADE